MSGVTVTVTTRVGVPIRATYHGGAYIDLAFPSSGVTRPIEVINVRDDAKNRSSLTDFDPDSDDYEENRRVLVNAVKAWVDTEIAEEKADNPDSDGWAWLDSYIENARYS